VNAFTHTYSIQTNNVVLGRDAALLRLCASNDWQSSTAIVAGRHQYNHRLVDVWQKQSHSGWNIDPMLMRILIVVAIAPSGCGTEPAPMPPREQCPSRECLLLADAEAEKELDFYATYQPETVWNTYYGKSEYGPPALLRKDDFIGFMRTREGREWLRGASTFFAAVRADVLTRCERARTSNRGSDSSLSPSTRKPSSMSCAP
jgi:hypothetical protein